MRGVTNKRCGAQQKQVAATMEKTSDGQMVVESSDWWFKKAAFHSVSAKALWQRHARRQRRAKTKPEGEVAMVGGRAPMDPLRWLAALEQARQRAKRARHFASVALEQTAGSASKKRGDSASDAMVVILVVASDGE